MDCRNKQAEVCISKCYNWQLLFTVEEAVNVFRLRFSLIETIFLEPLASADLFGQHRQTHSEHRMKLNGAFWVTVYPLKDFYVLHYYWFAYDHYTAAKLNCQLRYTFSLLSPLLFAYACAYSSSYSLPFPLLVVVVVVTISHESWKSCGFFIKIDFAYNIELDLRVALSSSFCNEQEIANKSEIIILLYSHSLF